MLILEQVFYLFLNTRNTIEILENGDITYFSLIVGIIVAILTNFEPSRAKVYTKYAGLAMLAGNFSSFMNACIAGNNKICFSKIYGNIFCFLKCEFIF